MLVRMPDGKVVRFPDDTSREEIARLIASRYGTPQERQQQRPDPTIARLEQDIRLRTPRPGTPVTGEDGVTVMQGGMDPAIDPQRPAATPRGLAAFRDYEPTPQARYDSALGNIRGYFPQFQGPERDQAWQEYVGKVFGTGDSGRLLQHGNTFGLSDEVSGVAGALGGLLDGSAGDRYGDFQELEQARVNLTRKNTGVGGMAAELLGGITSGMGAAQIGAAPASTMAQVLTGAGSGAAYGFANTEGGLGERGAGAVLPAMLGGAGAVVLPHLFRGAAALAQPAVNRVRGALPARAAPAPLPDGTMPVPRGVFGGGGGQFGPPRPAPAAGGRPAGTSTEEIRNAVWTDTTGQGPPQQPRPDGLYSKPNKNGEIWWYHTADGRRAPRPSGPNADLDNPGVNPRGPGPSGAAQARGAMEEAITQAADQPAPAPLAGGRSTGSDRSLPVPEALRGVRNPTSAQLREAAEEVYRHVDARGINKWVAPDAVQLLNQDLKRIASGLTDFSGQVDVPGYEPIASALKMMDELATNAAKGETASISQLDRIRAKLTLAQDQAAERAIGGQSGRRTMGDIADDMMDSFFGRLRSLDAARGGFVGSRNATVQAGREQQRSAQALVRRWQQARQLYAQYKNRQIIEDVIQDSLRHRGDQAKFIRDRFTELLASRRFRARFGREDLAEMERFARGGTGGRIAEWFARMGGGALGAAMGAPMGPAGAAAGFGAGAFVGGRAAGGWVGRSARRVGERVFTDAIRSALKKGTDAVR